MKISFKILNRNRIFYEYFLKKKILEVKEDLCEDELVERIMFLAAFSSTNHPGYYFDGRVENILFDYGRKLDEYVDKKRLELDIKKIISKKKYTILHVATKLYKVGGHTRMLYQFLRRHEDKNQVLVLTRQSIEDVPRWFTDGIENIPIISLDFLESVFDRAYCLRSISDISEKVILYHHPDDAIPIVAFSHDKCPPVLLKNHAHSWFWLGASVTDMVIAYSDFHKKFTLKTRPLKNVCNFRFTQLDDIETQVSQEDKIEAKRKLKISPDTICIITIGTAGKFIPNNKYNFFKTMMKIMAQFKNVELFVIGIAEGAELIRKYNFNTNKIHFVGTVNDPDQYFKAADICLDALPQPSLGGTTYAAIVGLACPLFKYGESNVFNVKHLLNAKLYDQYVGTTKNEKEYLEKLKFLIINPESRLKIAESIRDHYIGMFSKEKLKNYIREMLDSSDTIKHSPGKIPEGFYCHDADSAEIADTSVLQELSEVITNFRKYLTFADKIIIIALLSVKFMHVKDIIGLGGLFLKARIKYYIKFPFRYWKSIKQD